MKKTLLICAMAVCTTACVEHSREEYVAGYEYVPTYTYTTGCSACVQSTCNTCTTCNTCNTCRQPIQPVLYQQPKTIVVMVPPAPQPAVEHEIIYEPQQTCGCSKCGCNKKAAKAAK